ncbi:MAG: tetratricopeptide repeat protein [Steroidobacteraceae bacterium]
MTLAGLRTLLGIALLAAAAQAQEPTATPAVPADERLAANQEFRAAFDAGRYGEALPAAARVVEITRSQFGSEAPELVNPLTNLGTTYYRLQQYGTALDTYRAALGLLETDADTANPRLVAPLQGLGLSLRALDRDEEAIVPLKRAVDILRNREGLFALQQLPLLRPLAQAYMGAHRIDDAGSTQQYALTVAETAWGRNDPRLLPILDEAARWNEDAGRYAPAHLLHTRAVQIADRQVAGGHVLAVAGLRGIARTYRHAFLNGEIEEPVAATAGPLGSDPLLTRTATSPPVAGEQALRRALDLMQALTPDDAQLRGEVLTDLGDWYLTAGLTARAVAAYRDAWSSLQTAGAADLLATPAPLTYRPPSIAVSRRTEDPARFEEQDIDFMVSVDAQGEVREATAANPVAARESAERAVATALRRARFRPAIIDGATVTKTQVPFRERVYVRIAQTPAAKP